MGYELFAVRVESNRRISPDTNRLTFRGDFTRLHTGGPLGLRDMRIKVLLGGSRRDELLPDNIMDPSVYRQWLSYDERERGALRTYTLSSCLTGHTQGSDIDTLSIDVVVSDHDGPGATWGRTAARGDDALLFLPAVDHDAAQDTDLSALHGHSDDDESLTLAGIEYVPGPAQRVVLIGDSTALPAIRAIGWAESARPKPRKLSAVIAAPAGTSEAEGPIEGIGSVTWVSRSEMVAASVAHAWRVHDEVLRGGEDACAASCQSACQMDHESLSETEISQEILWDTPAYRRLLAEQQNSRPPAQPQCRQHQDSDCDCERQLFVWVAGESAKVVAIRRALVRQIGIKRRDVAFMGYWR